MTLWVRIDGQPVRQFVRNAQALPLVDPKLATHPILVSVGEMRSTGIGEENANVSITLDNETVQASALFALRPPIGLAAAVMDDDTPIFEGVITSVSLDAGVCSIEVGA